MLELPKFHICVYKVSGMFEIDVSAETDDRALEIAIEAAETNSFKKPDHNVVAVIPKE